LANKPGNRPPEKSQEQKSEGQPNAPYKSPKGPGKPSQAVVQPKTGMIGDAPNAFCKPL
jgi:hypothetical protein